MKMLYECHGHALMDGEAYADARRRHAAGVDIGAVRGTLLNLASSTEGVLTDPAPEVNVSAYNESSVTVTLRVWVASAKYWDVHFALRNGAEAALKASGVKIPFPQIDVHVKND